MLLCSHLSKCDLLSWALVCRSLSRSLAPVIAERKQRCQSASCRRFLDTFVPLFKEDIKSRSRLFSGPAEASAYYDKLQSIDLRFTDLHVGVFRLLRFLRDGNQRYGAVVNSKYYGTFTECENGGSLVLKAELGHHTVSMWDGSAWGAIFARKESFLITIERPSLQCWFSVNPQKYRYSLRMVVEEAARDFLPEWEEAKKRRGEPGECDGWADLKPANGKINFV